MTIHSIRFRLLGMTAFLGVCLILALAGSLTTRYEALRESGHIVAVSQVAVATIVVAANAQLLRRVDLRPEGVVGRRE